MRHPKSRLVAAAAVVGTACALAATSAAVAGPTHPFAGAGTVPGAYTNAAPGLSAIYRTGQGVRGTFVAWKGQNSNNIMYRFKIGAKWSPTGLVPGAHSTTSPAAAFYIDPHSVDAVVVVWKKLKSTNIDYSQGELGTKGGIKWTKPVDIKVGKDALAVSYSAPSVIFPLNSTHGRVLISWRGPGNHVRYELGAPIGRGFVFDPSSWIAGTNASLTDQAPALTEIAGTGADSNDSNVYVFWKSPGVKGQLNYATTPDNVGHGLNGNAKITWTMLGQVPGGKYTETTAAPAASSVNTHGTGPLLLAFKGRGGSNIRYLTLSGGVWSPLPIPGVVNGPLAQSNLGPALVNGLLANVAIGSSARIYLHVYTG
jgi:hypothetical protein